MTESGNGLRYLLPANRALTLFLACFGTGRRFGYGWIFNLMSCLYNRISFNLAATVNLTGFLFNARHCASGGTLIIIVAVNKCHVSNNGIFIVAYRAFLIFIFMPVDSGIILCFNSFISVSFCRKFCFGHYETAVVAHLGSSTFLGTCRFKSNNLMSRSVVARINTYKFIALCFSIGLGS